jgi:UDP-GlcNAc:undecaprenyl-phosphate GlcNAc-1-phosphate transferase
MQNLVPYLSVFALALALCAGLTPLAMRLARALGVMDRPNTPLKVQRQPVPYLGGVAMFLAFALALAFAKLRFFPHPSGLWPAFLDVFRGIYAILAGAFFSLVLGLVDDARVLSPKAKAAGQALIALLLVVLGLRVRFVHEAWLSALLTVFWVVAISNAVNFVDIMDGLAAGVGGLASLGFFIFSVHAGRVDDSIASLALAGACAGFLIFNFDPARVYMGDAGSLFLGFTLSAIALNENYSHQNQLAVFSPFLLLALPIFDLALMTFIRTRKGIPPWKGSPDHIPLRLKALGLGKRQVVLSLYGATAFLGAAAYLASFLKDSDALLVWGALGLGAFFLGAWLVGIPMPHDPKPGPGPKPGSPAA